MTALEGSGVLRDRPGLATLVVVGAGLVAGVAIGLLLRPDRHRILAYAGLAAAVAVAVYVLLLGAAQLRRPEWAPAVPLGAFLRGSLMVAAVQTAGAVPLWWLRSRSRRDLD